MKISRLIQVNPTLANDIAVYEDSLAAMTDHETQEREFLKKLF